MMNDGVEGTVISAETLLKIVITCCILGSSYAALAFDDDRRISAPNFRLETFLDIKSYEFSKRLNHQWYEADNGWRIASGSLDFDRLYLHSEFKLQQSLSKLLSLKLLHEEATYYDIKPAQRTEIELALTPFTWPFEFSFIGTPTYDKRQSDLGLGMTLGTRPWRFISIRHVQQDIYYNEKNVYDDSEYRRIPEVSQLSAGFQYGPVRFRLKANRDLPLWFQTSSDGTLPLTENFRSHGYDYDATAEYIVGKEDIVGLRFAGFWQEKSESDITQLTRTEQVLYHRLMEVYGIKQVSESVILTPGIQYDEFGDRIANSLAQSSHITVSNTRYDTLQVYSTLSVKHNLNHSWVYGLFIGDANKNRRHNTEAKFRISWHYQSDNGLGHFVSHVSINLDEYAQWDDAADAWNGGGISYQVLF